MKQNKYSKIKYESVISTLLLFICLTFEKANFVDNNIASYSESSMYFYNTLKENQNQHFNNFPRNLGIDSCNSYGNCYDCINNDGCYWCNETNSCYYYVYEKKDCPRNNNFITYGQTGDKWFFNQYYLCNRLSKCGEKDYDLEDGDVKINLENNLNKNEGCYWRIANFASNNYELSVKRKGKKEDQMSFINYNSFYLYDYVYDYDIPNYLSKKQESFYFKIIFYRNLGPSGDNNLEFSISGGSKRLSIVAIIIIVCCGVGFLLFLIIAIRCFCIFCCYRAQNQEREIIMLLNNNPLHNVNPQEVLKKFKEAKFEECRSADQLNCTICLQAFDNNEKIVSLPCHHYFHEKCISDWVRKKSEKPTCPNCNFDLLSEQQNIDQNSVINHVEEKKENVNESNNQVDLNDINIRNKNIEKEDTKVNKKESQKYNNNNNIYPSLHFQIEEEKKRRTSYS